MKSISSWAVDPPRLLVVKYESSLGSKVSNRRTKRTFYDWCRCRVSHYIPHVDGCVVKKWPNVTTVLYSMKYCVSRGVPRASVFFLFRVKIVPEEVSIGCLYCIPPLHPYYSHTLFQPSDSFHSVYSRWVYCKCTNGIGQLKFRHHTGSSWTKWSPRSGLGLHEEYRRCNDHEDTGGPYRTTFGYSEDTSCDVREVHTERAASSVVVVSVTDNTVTRGSAGFMLGRRHEEVGFSWTGVTISTIPLLLYSGAVELI